MTTYYVRTDGNNSNSGTSDSAGGAWLTLNFAGATAAAGDTIMVRASAGNASSYPTSSLDYTLSTYFTPTAGSTTAGHTKFIGYNGVPTVGCNGLGFYNLSNTLIDGIYFVATGNSNGGFGLVHLGAYNVLRNCTINLNNYTAITGTNLNSNNHVYRCEIYGGTTSPSFSSGCYGISMGSYANVLEGLRIRYIRDTGVYLGQSYLRNSLVYGCAGNGITITGTNLFASATSCTVNGNGGHGIQVNSTNGAFYCAVKSNIITNHTVSGKKGIYVDTASSDIRKAGWGWNNLYGNDGDYNNVTADSTDNAINPLYTDSANGNFTPTQTSLAGKGFPDAYVSGTTNYSYPGAIQPQGGGPFKLVGDGGGLVS